MTSLLGCQGLRLGETFQSYSHPNLRAQANEMVLNFEMHPLQPDSSYMRAEEVPYEGVP